MTMPALIAKHQKIVLANQLKTTFNLIFQSIEMSQGMIEDPEWAKNIDNKAMVNYTNEQKIADAEKYVTGNLKKTKVFGYIYPVSTGYFPTYKTMSGEQTAPTSLTGTDYYTMLLANGSFIFYKIDYNNDGTGASPSIYVDVNGKKGPNIIGKDVFLLHINTSGKLVMPGVEKSRDDLLELCKKDGSAATIYQSCGALIQKDGWVISKDYPW